VTEKHHRWVVYRLADGLEICGVIDQLDA